MNIDTDADIAEYESGAGVTRIRCRSTVFSIQNGHDYNKIIDCVCVMMSNLQKGAKVNILIQCKIISNSTTQK